LFSPVNREFVYIERRLNLLFEFEDESIFRRRMQAAEEERVRQEEIAVSHPRLPLN
jgi:hypothetical protein